MIKKTILFLSIFLTSINFVYAKETVTFSECVDGDTFKILVDNKEYSIRMLAIDTPESVHPQKGVEYYGKEASEYTCNKVKNATKLEIEYDPNEDKADKYGRLLVWVFTDGELLQKNLVANGYAKIGYLYEDYIYTSELEKVQELASSKSIGIWDELAKEKFEKDNQSKEENNDINEEQSTKDSKENYSKKDVIIIIILFLIVLFVGDKTIKNKAKKKLKKYLK